jgi:phospholipid transport system substrate-binding protein
VATREAVRKFQSDHGHTATGVPSPAFYRQLRAVKAPAVSSRDQATTLVKDTSDRLVAIANGANSTPEKRRRIQAALDPAVDTDDLARACLGRFWHSATPFQQKQYTALFRELLVTRVANHLGREKGVRVTMGSGRSKEDAEIILTTLDRPKATTSKIDWVVSTAAGKPKVVGLLTEGVSMRVTQTDELNSYVSRNAMDALLEAIRKQNARAQ